MIWSCCDAGMFIAAAEGATAWSRSKFPPAAALMDVVRAADLVAATSLGVGEDRRHGLGSLVGVVGYDCQLLVLHWYSTRHYLCGEALPDRRCLYQLLVLGLSCVQVPDRSCGSSRFEFLSEQADKPCPDPGTLCVGSDADCWQRRAGCQIFSSSLVLLSVVRPMASLYALLAGCIVAATVGAMPLRRLGLPANTAFLAVLHACARIPSSAAG